MKMKKYAMKVGLAVLAVLLSVVATGIALLPLWAFLWAKAAIHPDSFLEKFVVFGAGFYFLAGAQVCLIVMLGIALAMIWAGLAELILE